MTTVIIDTDFLSPVLKIGQSDLIRAFYTTADIRIPIAVYCELARADLLPALLAIKWLEVDPVELLSNEPLLDNSTFRDLGAGEQACLTLARTAADNVVLMSDNQARALARSLSITVVNLPAFLLACKVAGLIDRAGMAQIIQDLKDKDYYEFKTEIRVALLS